MARLAAVLVACATGALGACSPYGGGAFACTEDTQCGAGGRCSGGFCSFPDPDCDSGYRFGELSGPRSGECVAAAADAGVDGGPSCFGSSVAMVCFDAMPSGARTLAAAIDTDDDGACDPIDSDAYCAIGAASITVDGTVAATGSRPLVLVATDAITIAGAVPASDTTRCTAAAATGTSGGGAGGSFGSRGGNGGASTGAGGVSGAVVDATSLRGGCRGQNGNNGTPGIGGMGGGAVYLHAGTQITVLGVLNASGAGATAGVTGLAGGGGGGSGGMIVLDAPAVTNSGVIFANGGGGAEGSGNTTRGTDGNEPTGTAAAPATASSSNGGEGGNGASQATAAGNGVQNTTYGGGGGGGGLGVIRLIRATSLGGGGGVSPSPM